MSEHDSYEEYEEAEEIEAYCMHCREHTVIVNPTPVWTRKGSPATRGECEMCGTTVFRMGRTDAHREIAKPNMDRMKQAAGGSLSPTARGPVVAFVNYSPADIYFASRLAEDLDKVGVPTWFDPGKQTDDIEWATGLHPAIEECSHMVVVLSDSALEAPHIVENWEGFKERRKPVVIAQIDAVEVPDILRRSPRFLFYSEDDYKTSLREMVQAIAR